MVNIDINSDVFKSYAFWSSVLVLKMLFMSFLTAIQRFKNKAFANPEDLPSQKMKVKLDEPSVERVRRAHRNDLENILIFFVVAFLYIQTSPSVFLATNLIRAFAIARIVHTIVYAVMIVPQPARALAWFVGVGVTVYMAVNTILFYKIAIF